MARIDTYVLDYDMCTHAEYMKIKYFVSKHL